MKTKLFTLLLAVAASVGTMFASDTQVNGIWYNFDSSTKTASVAFQGASHDAYLDEYSGDIVVPSSVIYDEEEYNVTSIGEYAFWGCSGLTSVVIPNSVTSIDSSAFSGCIGLTSMEIPNSVATIGDGAFFGCSGLTSMTIPNSVTSIGNSAFVNCKGLTSIEIPNSVTHIGSYAFKSCTGLTSIEIPNSVTSIEKNTFEHCSGLTYLSIDIKSIGDYAFKNCNGLVHVEISDDVTSIGKNTFESCSNLTSVIIGSRIESIGNYAFKSCSQLTSIIIKAAVPPTLGGKNIFQNDTYCHVYVPYGTLETYLSAWGNISVTITYAPLPYSIFINSENGNVAYVALGEYTIGDELQHNYQLTSIPNYGYHFVQWSDSITDNPRIIELTQDTTFTAEFAKNSYTITTNSANPAWGATTGDTTALYLDSIEISAISIYGYHFVQWDDYNTENPRVVSITEDKTYTATFTKNVYSIIQNAEHGSISGNTSAEYLDEVTLSVSADYGYHFVQWSDGVTDNPRTFVITQDTTFTAEFAKNSYTISTISVKPEWGTTAGDTTTLYLDEVEISGIPNYGYHFVQWDDDNTENPRTVSVTEDKTYTATFAKNVYSIATNVEHGTISGNSSAEYLDVVELIAEPDHGYHFAQWSDGVTDNPRTFIVTQDTTFTAIFAQTFSGQCGDNLYWEYVNDTLKLSGDGAMYNYSMEDVPWSLFYTQAQHIEFAHGITSISNFAFQNMNNLPKVNLPSEIVTIGEYAFTNCSSIKKLTIPNSVTSIGSGAFAECSSMDTLIIGTGVTFITDQFSGCTGLRYLQLSQNMQKVGSGAFIDAERLNYIVCHAKYPPIAYADKGSQLRSFYNMNARVLVPCDNFEDYEVDALWGSFNLKCLSSESGTAVDGQVTVIPGDADATFTWPTDGSAETYNLEITKEGVVFCTLTFNSQGQLLGIHFAPSRDGKPHQMPSANLTTNGMTFQVTGLDYASQYRFSFETKNATQTIFAYTGAFSTNGAQGVENVQVDSEIPTKVLIDGQIFILRGEKVYSITGQEVQ